MEDHVRLNSPQKMMIHVEENDKSPTINEKQSKMNKNDLHPVIPIVILIN